MLSIFPTPHPDEIFYSLAARYGEQLGYTNKEQVNVDLFGVRSASATIDLPCRLKSLTERLPDGHRLSTARLINQYTLLPFYSPFLQSERFMRVRNDMCSSNGGAIHNVTGINASTIRPPRFLRFCPRCVEVDRREFRECYWHRLHQVPGVLVCPQHSVFLENSEVEIQNRINTSVYISAEEACLSLTARPISVADTEHTILTEIANDVSWLLNQENLCMGFQSLVAAYVDLLKEKGLASVTGMIKSGAIPGLLISRYTQGILDQLQCSFDGTLSYNWPSLLVKSLNRQKHNHPLRHLLLIRALGHTAASFFSFNEKRTEKQNSKPFGSGPWPCLNPVCSRFGKREIHSIVITKNRTTHAPIGYASCSCEFVYLLSRTSQPGDSRLSHNGIKSYGPLWDAALIELWKDSSLSTNAIKKRLGVHEGTVKRQALRLGLKFPRVGPSTKSTNVSPEVKAKVTRVQKKKSDSIDTRVIGRYRNQWKVVRLKYPNAGRTVLRKTLATSTYSWLYRNDHEWLMNNMPPPYRRTESARKVDWSSRDPSLAAKVMRAAETIKNRDGRPERITVSVIGRLAGSRWVLQDKKYLGKLPLTQQALGSALESQLVYYERKIAWAIRTFPVEGPPLSFSTLAQRAAIKWEKWYQPEIKKLLLNAIDNFGRLH